MAITVRRLAQQPDLGLTLVAGRDNADRRITWAHAIELADPAPYLFGGELVMTTGINVGTSATEQFDYIARLSAANVAALAFDTGTSFRQVPDGIVAAGDALGMPILAVPASTPFIAITRAVIDEVNADQIRSVQRTVDQQELMARETLRGGIPALVLALSRALSATSVVLGADGRILAAGGPDQDRITELSVELVRTARPRTPRGQSTRVVADGDGYCTLQALRASQTVRGHLVVRSAEPLTTADRVLVAHAVSLISIELEKPARVIDSEQRLRTVVAQALLSGPHVVDHAVLRFFGFDPESGIIAVVLTGIGPELAAQGHAHRILEPMGSPYLLCTREDELVLVLPAEETEQSRIVHQTLSAQLQRPLHGGVSLPTTFADFTAGFHQAQIAARATPRHELCSFGELGPFGVILGTRSRRELEILCRALLPLDKHDREHATSAGPGLVTTLETFLKHNGQVENAAAALDIHRHTLRNRIVKISELLGCDLQSADTRANLWIALKARELLGLAPP